MFKIAQVLRPLLRHIPFQFGKGRLAELILDNRNIPEGELVRTKDGIVIKTHADWMYKKPYLYGEYEPNHTGLIKKLVLPGNICLDIGANFGYYSALLARLVQPGGKVYAFEPIPKNAELAIETFALNDVSQTIVLERCALGNASGSLTVFTFDDLTQGHASSGDLGRPNAKPHVCPVTTLDIFMASNNIDSVDFLKIDVEGDELNVFRGAQKLLSDANAPIVTFEINQTCLATRGINADIVLKCLQEYGYSKFYHIPYRGKVVAVSSLTNKDSDYLALKPSRLLHFAGGILP